MPLITEIKAVKKGRVSVYLGGEPALEIASDVLVARGLRSGMELSAPQLAELKKADEIHRALEAAMHYLEYRPRSEKELRDRLRRGAFPPDVTAAAMARLRQLGLADDASFARFWKEGREATRPRSKRMMKQELWRKGLNQEIIQETVKDVDEESGAYRIASKKAHSMNGLDEKAFYRRLGSFLQSRGYNYDLARRTVERVWQETRHTPLETEE
ncbi:MAG: RecX family transcriptional regulator [Chloroflexi bacterium]|nr:RecX family transcriptional regulator [Chloroflexota bacterium]